MKIVYIICYCKISSKNPRLDVANALGQTPLHLLTRRCAIGAVEELIRLGASVHKTDYNGEGFLFYSLGTQDQFEQLISIYIAHNGDLNVVNNNGVI